MNTNVKSMAVPEDLPRGIIIDILSRLPVKSLLQIKCVCKSSRALISSLDFLEKHRLSRDNNRIILCDCYGMQICSFRQHDASLRKEFVYSFGNNNRKIRVNGSCDGLVCYSSTEKNRLNVVTVLNLSTKESKKIIHRTDRGGFTSYGFGCDCLAEDYKLVGIVCKRGDLGKKEVSVYQLKKNEKSSWRRIEDFPSGRISSDSAKYVKGSLNWVVRIIKGNNRDSLDAWVIVSLDLSKEVYSRVRLPEAVCGGEGGTFEPSLGVAQGCLALICKYPNCLRVDVWVMKEFGVGDSWTRLISIPYLNSKDSLKSLLFLKNGDVVVVTQSGIVTLFDTQQNKFKKLYETRENKNWYPIVIAGFDLCLPLEESLVSPNA